MADLTVPVPAAQGVPVSAPVITPTPTPAVQQVTPTQPKPQPTAEQIEAFVAADRRRMEEVFAAKQNAERWQRENNSVQSEMTRLRNLEASLKDPTKRYSVLEQYGGDVVNYAEAVAKGTKVSPSEEIAQLREEIKALTAKTSQVETGMSVGMYARGLDKVLSDAKYAPILEFQKIMGNNINLEGAAQVALDNKLSPDAAADQMLEYSVARLAAIRAALGIATSTPATTPAPAPDPAVAAIDALKPKPTLTNAMGTVSAPVSAKHMTWEEREKAVMEIARQYDREQGR